MAKRATLDNVAPAEDGGLFLASTGARPYFSSGCTIFDLSLGDGWISGGIISIAGDSGAGKSLIAAEAVAEFLVKFDKAKALMLDREHAYDVHYMERLGMPMDRITILPKDDAKGINRLDTVTDLEKYLYRLCWKGKEDAGSPIVHKDGLIVVVDSWDALGDKQENSKDMGESNAQGSKAKAGSEFGRRLRGKLACSNITLIVVSQIREKLGVFFGPSKFVAGGNWLNFYADQRVWVGNARQIESTRNGVKRAWAQMTRATFKKSRRIEPMPPIRLPIVYNYGVDDLLACVAWLHDVGKVHLLLNVPEKANASETEKAVNKYIAASHKFDDERAETDLRRAKKIVRKVWAKIRKDFSPARTKRRA
jgi:RecA/RadA recombinase